MASYYTISTDTYFDSIKKAVTELGNISGYGFFVSDHSLQLEDSNWLDHFEDVLKFSELYPDHELTLTKDLSDDPIYNARYIIKDGSLLKQFRFDWVEVK